MGVCTIFPKSICCLSWWFWQLTVSYGLHFQFNLHYFRMGLGAWSINHRCFSWTQTSILCQWMVERGGNDWFRGVVWKEVDLMNWKVWDLFWLFPLQREVSSGHCANGWEVCFWCATEYLFLTSQVHTRVGQGRLGWNLNLYRLSGQNQWIVYIVEQMSEKVMQSGPG